VQVPFPPRWPRLSSEIDCWQPRNHGGAVAQFSLQAASGSEAERESGPLVQVRGFVLTALQHEHTASDLSLARHVAAEFVRCTIFAPWYNRPPLQATYADTRLSSTHTTTSPELHAGDFPVCQQLELCYIDCTGFWTAACSFEEPWISISRAGAKTATLSLNRAWRRQPCRQRQQGAYRRHCATSAGNRLQRLVHVTLVDSRAQLGPRASDPR
jgi:hypothetical protein